MADIGPGSLFDNLRNLISLIDSLRDIGVQEYISLPRIAVLGTQSAGKSSLLESIVGMDFLPRGDGVVTRRPLELRLSRTKDAVQPWGIFKGDPKKYTNFDEIRENIISLTEKLCGNDKNIIDDPIILTVYSADCPDLTIIDLPGITRIPMGGQPKNIEEITKKMVTNYCKDPKTVILAVIPGNADMSTSESLQLAMALDPEGKRTIGVITKIDIMDKGTDATSMLNNEEIPLRLGYVGVKGRSQADIKGKVKVKEALKEEAKYFSEHPVYSSLSADTVGTTALVTKLTTVLYTLIKENMPALRTEIVKRRELCARRLKELGPGLPTGEKDKFEFVWQLADELCSLFVNELNGKYDIRREDLNKSKKKSVSSEINIEFDEYFEDYATIKYQVIEKHSDEEIYGILTAYSGGSLPGFPSMDAFLFLMLPKLDLLKQPTYELLDKVHEKLEQSLKDCCSLIFKRFPAIEMEIFEIINHDLAKKKEDTRTILRTLMECEENYLFTNDTEYISDNLHKYIDDTAAKKREESKNTFDKGKFAIVNSLRRRINAYFYIVSRNLKDSIPKIIGTFLIQGIMKDIKFVLFNNISKANSFLNRMTEPNDIANERASLQKQYDVLRKAERRILADPSLGGMTSGDEDIYEVLQKKQDEFTKTTLGNLREKESLPETFNGREAAENSHSPVRTTNIAGSSQHVTKPSSSPQPPSTQPVPVVPVKKPAAATNLFGNLDKDKK